MIAYLRGEVVTVTDRQLVLDVNHVGFRVAISSRDAQAMPPAGEEVMIHTFMSVREDDISLIGFLNEDDLMIYRMLIGVSGIGPKGALGILSAMSADDVRFAVISDDAKLIAKAPGIGVKTAQKLILELKDKFRAEDLLPGKLRKEEPSSAFVRNRQEAAELMVALGYSRSEALQALRRAALTEDMTTDQILNAALRGDR